MKFKTKKQKNQYFSRLSLMRRINVVVENIQTEALKMPYCQEKVVLFQEMNDAFARFEKAFYVAIKPEWK